MKIAALITTAEGHIKDDLAKVQSRLANLRSDIETEFGKAEATVKADKDKVVLALHNAKTSLEDALQHIGLAKSSATAISPNADDGE